MTHLLTSSVGLGILISFENTCRHSALFMRVSRHIGWKPAWIARGGVVDFFIAACDKTG
jgi:hypothetical protein